MTRESYGDVFCPSCGVIGQLTRHQYIRKMFSYSDFEVIHFKTKKGKIVCRIPMNRWKRKYAYSCYIGKIVLTSGYEVVYPQPSLFAVALRMRIWL